MYATAFCPQSYSSMGWSPAELDESEPKTVEELKALAVADDYEKYADLLPFNEWDYLEGEEPTDTWLEAAEKLAEFDNFSLYDGETEVGELTVAKAAELQQENQKRVLSVSVRDVKAVDELKDSIQVPALTQSMKITQQFKELS